MARGEVPILSSKDDWEREETSKDVSPWKVGSPRGAAKSTSSSEWGGNAVAANTENEGMDKLN